MAIYILWRKIKAIEGTGMSGVASIKISPVSNSSGISLKEVGQETEISLETLRGLRMQYGASSEEYKTALNEINTIRNK